MYAIIDFHVNIMKNKGSPHVISFRLSVTFSHRGVFWIISGGFLSLWCGVFKCCHCHCLWSVWWSSHLICPNLAYTDPHMLWWIVKCVGGLFVQGQRIYVLAYFVLSKSSMKSQINANSYSSGGSQSLSEFLYSNHNNTIIIIYHNICLSYLSH